MSTGDALFPGFTSNTVTVPVGAVASSTTLTASDNPSVFGEPVTFVAKVTSATGATPTGTVTLFDGATAIGWGTLVNGSASVSVSALTVRTHSITAVYSGNGTGSTSNAVSQTVNRADTQMSVVFCPNPARINHPTTLGASVTVVTPGAGVPAGTVTFRVGTVELGTVALDAAGVATLAVTFGGSQNATYLITATYSGSGNYSGSSNTLALKVR